jgi:hypothetical protein
MFAAGFDAPLDDAEVFTSPLHKPALPSSFDWAEGLPYSSMSMPGYESPSGSGPMMEFGMAEIPFSECFSGFDVEKPPALPIPMISPETKPRQKLFPFRPSVLRPFTSFEATELAVEQLRRAFRRNEHKMNLERKKG